MFSDFWCNFHIILFQDIWPQICFFRDMGLHHHTLIWRFLDWMLLFPLELALVIILVDGASLLLMKYITLYISTGGWDWFFFFFFQIFISLTCLLVFMWQYGRPLYGDVFGVQQQELPNYEVWFNARVKLP